MSTRPYKCIINHVYRLEVHIVYTVYFVHFELRSAHVFTYNVQYFALF